jgi:aspartate racemase
MIKRLGILGGMGPAASAEFVNRLVQQTPASCDQEHVPFVLWNNPQIPDRSTSMRNGDNAPLPLLIEGIAMLKAMSCDHIVIPCNSAHYWYDDLIKIGVPITHIVDSVANELKRLSVENQTIGIMGTQGTIEFGIYQRRLEQQGWPCIIPSQQEMDILVQPAIDLIKAGKIQESQTMLMTVIQSLINRGAKAVVLGCTELPLAIRITEEKGVSIVNSIDSLVKVAITY